MRRSACQLLAYPDVTIGRLSALWPELAAMPPAVATQLENDGRYRATWSGRRPTSAPSAGTRTWRCRTTSTTAWSPGCRAEVRRKLAQARPATLAAAARIPGVTPAALTALLAHVRRRGDQPRRSA